MQLCCKQIIYLIENFPISASFFARHDAEALKLLLKLLVALTGLVGLENPDVVKGEKVDNQLRPHGFLLTLPQLGSLLANSEAGRVGELRQPHDAVQ